MVKENELFQVLASYLPSGFAIELKGYNFIKPPAGPGMPVFDDVSHPVFMHEVAHLVQDRATFRGVMDFNDIWDQVEAMRHHVASSGPSVSIPMVDLDAGTNRLDGATAWALELAALRDSREPRIGWTQGRFWAFSDYSVTRRNLTLSGRHINNYPFVTVHLIDNTTEEQYDHPLGSWEICEAYSVAVEMLHGGQVANPDLPFEYLVVERIISKYFGDVPPATMIAFCHWALHDLAPANTLFSLIEHIEDNFDALPSAAEVYDVGRQDAVSRGFQTNCNDILVNLQDREQVWMGYDRNLGEMLSWFRTHAEKLLSLQLRTDRRFPLDTFLCNPNQILNTEPRKAVLEQFVQEVEIPLIIWPEGEYYSIGHSPASVPAVFLNRSMLHLFQNLWAGSHAEWKCPLFNGCTLQFKDDSDCLARPWLKSTIQPRTCPYGAAAKLIGLDGKTIRYQPVGP